MFVQTNKKLPKWESKGSIKPRIKSTQQSFKEPFTELMIVNHIHGREILIACGEPNMFEEGVILKSFLNSVETVKICKHINKIPPSPPRRRLLSIKTLTAKKTLPLQNTAST